MCDFREKQSEKDLHSEGALECEGPNLNHKKTSQKPWATNGETRHGNWTQTRINKDSFTVAPDDHPRVPVGR